MIGDSEAQTTIGMFAEMALRDGMTMSTYASAGCPWQRNLFFDAPDAFHRRWTAQCKAVKRDLYDRVLPALRPDVIVATSLDYLSDRTHLATLHNASDHPVAPGRGGVRAQFARETRHSLDLLTRYGAKVVMVEPLPVTTQSHDPFQCLLHANDAERCRFTADPGIPDVVNQVYRAAADDRTVFSIDLDRAACPSLPTCDAVSGGQVTRFDYEHMTPRFAAATLGPTVTRWFVQHGLLPA